MKAETYIRRRIYLMEVVELPEKLDFELIPLVRAQSTVFEAIEDLFTSDLMG